MDPTKKRKLDENGVGSTTEPDSPTKLTPEDARKMMERFTNDQLLDILQTAVVRHPDVLASVRAVADADPTQRKLFIRGLGWDTTSDTLRSLFSTYGELEEAVVILDKSTGKSKGYGFVIFKHVEGALLALREPSKKIDGRVTVTQLAAAGNSGANNSGSLGGADVAGRKIYVANVPNEMPADKLLAQFAQYGEIEEGPLGFDKQTGKSRGFALFVYKTVEGAQAALVEPTKVIEGRHLNCKLAIDGKKGKGGAGAGAGGGAQGDGLHGPVQGGAGNAHDGMGMGMNQGGYGGPGGMGVPYGGGFSGGPPQGLGMGSHGMNSSMGGGGPGVGMGMGMGSQAPGSLGGSGGGMGAPYGGYGGPGSTGYGASGSTGYGGPGSTGYGGIGAGSAGGGSSMYRLPPSSAGMSSGGFPETGHYTSSSASFQGPHQGTPPAPRIPHGGAYPNVPPYY